MGQNLTNDNKELFKDAAWHYSRFRPAYPHAFFDKVISYFDLDGKGRLLDLGCGTGHVILPLAGYFQEGIGLDIDAGMLDEAKRIAEKQGIKNITWVHGKAEEISPTIGVFRLVTMGASFHWMEQDTVLKKIYGILQENGGIAIIGGHSAIWRNPERSEWKEVCKKVIIKYLGEKRRAGSSFYQEPKRRFEEILVDSPFHNFNVWGHAYEETRSIESIIGRLYTTSFAAKRLFGDNAAAFEKELRAELLKIDPSGEFKEEIKVEAFFARKVQ